MKKMIIFALFTLFIKNSFGQTTVSIDSLDKHLGENVIVCARAYGFKSTDKITLINIGAHYPNAPLTVVIFAKNIDKFKNVMENIITDKTICITGTIKNYKGKNEIIVSDANNILIQK